MTPECICEFVDGPMQGANVFVPPGLNMAEVELGRPVGKTMITFTYRYIRCGDQEFKYYDILLRPRKLTYAQRNATCP